MKLRKIEIFELEIKGNKIELSSEELEELRKCLNPSISMAPPTEEDYWSVLGDIKIESKEELNSKPKITEDQKQHGNTSGLILKPGVIEE